MIDGYTISTVVDIRKLKLLSLQNATPFEFAFILDFARKRNCFTDGSFGGKDLSGIYCVDCMRNKCSL